MSSPGMPHLLPSGRYRGRVRDPRSGKQIAPHVVIGGPSTYPDLATCRRAEGDHRTGDLEQPGGVVWDAFLAFGASARWQTEPSDLLTAGSTIIANTDSLERAFVPALAGA